MFYCSLTFIHNIFHLNHSNLCKSVTNHTAMKRIKTHRRNKIGDYRLSNLAVIAIEIQLVESLNVEKIIDRFAAEKNCRIDLTLRN